MDLDTYTGLRSQLVGLGYGDEIAWAQTVQPVQDPHAFWCEFAWVVLNSGMKNSVAKGIWAKVRPVVESGGSAREVFGHKGKAAAIDFVYRERSRLFDEYLAAEDKLGFIVSLPWIGDITKFHLAKNYGLNTSKPDRHLVRIAGAEGVTRLCERLASESGDRVGTVDLVLWRAAAIGLIDTRAMATPGAAV
jgi:hypothetical protein